MSVLDVGCGTGAITAGMARIVGPEGHVLGLDRDESLLALARREHQSVQNLSFQNGDVLLLQDWVQCSLHKMSLQMRTIEGTMLHHSE